MLFVVAGHGNRTGREHSPRICHVLMCAVRESFCAIATACAKPQINPAFARRKKVAASSWGELAARDPIWDGEGWGCDRVACLRFLLLSG